MTSPWNQGDEMESQHTVSSASMLWELALKLGNSSPDNAVGLLGLALAAALSTSPFSTEQKTEILSKVLERAQ